MYSQTTATHRSLPFLCIGMALHRLFMQHPGARASLVSTSTCNLELRLHTLAGTVEPATAPNRRYHNAWL